MNLATERALSSLRRNEELAKQMSYNAANMPPEMFRQVANGAITFMRSRDRQRIDWRAIQEVLSREIDQVV